MLQATGVYTQIWNNNMRSILLLGAFPLLIFLIITGLVSMFTIFVTAPDPYHDPDYLAALSQAFNMTLQSAHWILLGTALWFTIAWLFHDRMVRRAVRAHPLPQAQYPSLYRMVEELCISRGLPMPHLSLIHSSALNAFASGMDKKTYRITVTTGLLDTLSFEELKAVYAHELSHILHKDTRFMMISLIFVGIFSLLSDLAMGFVRSHRYATPRRNTSKNGQGIFLFMVLAFLLLFVGKVFALLIRLSLSRRREFMADAGAVTLTKAPSALIAALQKIALSTAELHVPNEMHAMMIGPKPQWYESAFSLFRTHPPLEQRIRALEMMGGKRTPLEDLLPETTEDFDGDADPKPRLWE